MYPEEPTKKKKIKLDFPMPDKVTVPKISFENIETKGP